MSNNLTGQDLISVIIPVYNVKPYLDKCIKSVLYQTYKNLEIILVDDGSTDGCSEMCDQYAIQDKRIKVVHKINEGLVSSRKEGIKVASGNLIGYVDSDDWVEPNMYEVMYSKMKEVDADIIVTCHYENFESYQADYDNYIKPGVYTGDHLIRDVFGKMLYVPSIDMWGVSANCWNKLFTKKIVYQHQLDVDNIIADGEDHAFVFSAMLDAKCICFIKDKFYHHRVRPGSVSLHLNYDCFTRFAYLAALMEKKFTKTPYWDMVLKEQLPYHFRKFIQKYTMMVLGVELYTPSDQEYVFPFSHVSRGDRIVLYGAADVGEIYYRQIKTTAYCELVAWVAQTCRNKQLVDFVQEPNVILNLTYDYIVIAAKRPEVVQSIKHDLQIMGVDKNKIIDTPARVKTLSESAL